MVMNVIVPLNLILIFIKKTSGVKILIEVRL